MGVRAGLLCGLLFFCDAVSAVDAAMPAPPTVRAAPRAIVAPHGATRLDPYAWLRDDTRSDPAVLAHLRRENTYADAVLAPLRALQAQLQREATSVADVDESLPYRVADHWYYRRTEAGRQYPVYLRRRDAEGAREEILLDVDALARGRASYRIGAHALSPDGHRLAYAEDPTGQRQHTVRVKDLRTGRTLPLRLEQRAASLAWSNDGRTLFTVENDAQTLQPRRVTRTLVAARAGSDASDPDAIDTGSDASRTVATDIGVTDVVYEEPDPGTMVGVERSRSGEYVCIATHGIATSEYRCADADGPGDASAFVTLAPREPGVTYFAQHFRGRWIVLTDWHAPNFRIMTADDAGGGDRSGWRDFIAHDPAVQIEGVEFFDTALVLNERVDGQLRLRIVPEHGAPWTLASDDAIGALRLGRNPDPASGVVRYNAHTLTKPRATLELDLATRQTRLLQRAPAPARFDAASDAYVSERRWITARDGTAVPVSLAYRRDLPRDGTAALLQTGYGAYGMSLDPTFNPMLPAMLDRGVVYAIAHVRGGGELGRDWYDAGRLARKTHSVTDFVDVTAALVEAGYAAPDRVAAVGSSAGGLLVGAAANLAPERYRAIVAQVPFVDLVTTMLDPNLPLTATERDEWGDPADPAAYRAMLAFSPYDGVAPRSYPAMYVSAGLWDSQVPYFEPAKWVAKLRAATMSTSPIVLRTDMHGGHDGAASRARAQSAAAETYAFVLAALRATDPMGSRRDARPLPTREAEVRTVDRQAGETHAVERHPGARQSGRQDDSPQSDGRRHAPAALTSPRSPAAASSNRSPGAPRARRDRPATPRTSRRRASANTPRCRTRCRQTAGTAGTAA